MDPKSIPDGGPAFPPMHDPDTHASGMTLRDYFAANAIGMMAWTDSTLDDCAKASYLIADAMLKARKGDKDA